MMVGSYKNVRPVGRITLTILPYETEIINAILTLVIRRKDLASARFFHTLLLRYQFLY